MRTGTRNARIFSSLAIGLLVLAGICLDGRPVLAQGTCPLPAGEMAPEPPSVTAQDVENDRASLMDFALGSRERFESRGQDVLTPQQLAYRGCLLREEGGPWRSGSTYIVNLTPDGRVYLHAKDMALSGRRLNPSIYAGILRALQIPPEVLLGLRSPDPATRSGAQSTLLSLLRSKPHAPFDLTGPGAGGQPGFPGASGYAAAYRTVNTENPLILLVGFDLNAIHHLVDLADEGIDYGNPAITASEVVDRHSLKTFVTEALRFIVGTQRNVTSTAESRAAFAKATLALRDPDPGRPWRHGSTYLYIVDGNTNLILFHAAFPDRFELQPAGVSRDAVTGELIFDQIVAAAASGPDGGFFQYHFDDPNDDSDRVDIPKVGYARQFVRTITTSDGTQIETNLIIGSGFYLTTDSEFVERILEALDDGQESMMFSITTPEDGGVVAGDDEAISVTGAPTETVYFAYRLAGLADEAFTYLGAATNRDGVASFTWDTLDLPDDDYELVALYTEDEGEEGEGESVIYDKIEVSVDNVGGGGGGCAALPVLPGGPVDPTLIVLVGLLTVYVMLGRRRPMRHAALG